MATRSLAERPAAALRSLPEILKAARAGKRKPVLACAAAADAAVLEGVRAAVDIGLVHPILIGDRSQIRAMADRLGIGLHGMEVMHVQDSVAACRQAVALCRSGEAAALMKGSVATAVILATVLDRSSGLNTGAVLSHATVFRPRSFDRLMLLADAGVNIAPDVKCTLQIVRNTVELARMIGICKPRVALLAAVEKVTIKMPVTAVAAEIASAFNEQFGTLAYIGGPYSLDVAVSRDAALLKGIDDEVAGRGDVLIAPNIETGNILYKSLTCFSGCHLASLVCGASVPLVIPSRADSSRTKLYSIALATLVANQL